MISRKVLEVLFNYCRWNQNYSIPTYANVENYIWRINAIKNVRN